MVKVAPEPVFVYDDKNQPTWPHKTTVKVTRMDNSLAITEHVGTLNRGGRKSADILTAMGGIGIIILHVYDSKNAPARRYAIDCSEAIKEVFARDAQLRKAPERPLRKKTKRGARGVPHGAGAGAHSGRGGPT